jgi:hypothetical protein
MNEMLSDLTPKIILFQNEMIFIFPLPDGEGEYGKASVFGKKRKRE